jgi:two-component system, LuxR family, response regulator FixJ
MPQAASLASGARPAAAICIVDDDEVVRDSLRAVLESRSYSVTDFGSGADLLASGAAAQVDCLVLDVHMPEMTGIDVLRELVARGIHTPVILISGRSDAGVVAQAKALGAIALLDKPVGHAALFDAIRRAIDRKTH